MKILMFGRGVVASVYGWAFEQAGHEVEFFVRPGRAAEYGAAIDLELTDLRRLPRIARITRRWPVSLREQLAPEDGFDLIVVSVAHNRLPAAMTFLAPRIGRATVLVLGNLWDDLSDAAGPIPADHVEWGFPGAGGGFQPDGTLRAGLLPSVRLGTHDGGLSVRGRAVREVFRSAGIRVREETDIAGWLAVHFVANAGVHAQGIRLGSLSQLAGDTHGLREALLTSRELLPVLAARGVDLDRHRGSTIGFRHPRPLAPLLGWVTRHVGPARVSLAAQTDPLAQEPRAICRDALAAAREHDVPVPRLEAVADRFIA